MRIIKVAKPTPNNRYKVKIYDVFVDDKDYDFVRQYNWIFRNGYAATKIGHRYQSMHRLIMGVLPKDPTIVDHIDNNKLNNQRENLRKCDRFQNQQNRKTNRKNTLPKGIRKLPSGRYNVRIQTYGERQIIGTFDTLEEAVDERNRVAKLKHKDFFNPSYVINNEANKTQRV